VTRSICLYRTKQTLSPIFLSPIVCTKHHGRPVCVKGRPSASFLALTPSLTPVVAPSLAGRHQRPVTVVAPPPIGPTARRPLWPHPPE
jgi:hypothetical protein